MNSLSLPRYATFSSPALPLGLPLVVTHGCRSLGIQKGSKAIVDAVEKETCSHGGYRIHLWLPVGGRTIWLYCASSARFTGPVVSLNSGNPLHNVKFARPQ